MCCGCEYPESDADHRELVLKTNRNPLVYLLVMAVLVGLALPARLIPEHLPWWYVRYFADYLWAMLVFFGAGLIFRKLSTWRVAVATLLLAYLTEITQLFHPLWLDHLRSIPWIGLLIGYGFLWSDIAAYTLGIGTGALIEHFLLRKIPKRKG